MSNFKCLHNDCQEERQQGVLADNNPCNEKRNGSHRSRAANGREHNLLPVLKREHLRVAFQALKYGLDGARPACHIGGVEDEHAAAASKTFPWIVHSQ
jgi:hypothetical protein